MSIYKACDIRGRYGRDLTDQHARALGSAIVRYSRPDRVLVCGDGRVSTPSLREALIDGLTSSGAHAVSMGTAPTPAFHYALGKTGIATGVMVTASHNPAEDNGFKLVLSGEPVTPHDMSELERLAAQVDTIDLVPQADRTDIDVLDDYADHLCLLYRGPSGLRVAVDSGNGVMGLVAPAVLRRLGHEVVELFTEVDGRFPNHPANPAQERNLRALSAVVSQVRADIGVAFDGDGDRAGFVDERGRPVPTDKAVVLLLRSALEAHPGSPVIYDQKCSMIVPEAIAAAGGVPIREKSGHAFIKTALRQAGAAYAGEVSGHHFFGDIGGDDALLALLRMMETLDDHRRAFSELVDDIPHYPATPDVRVPMDVDEARGLLLRLAEHLTPHAVIDTTDGVRATFPDGWGLVRLSVTEPVVTLRCEGRTPDALHRIRSQFADADQRLGSGSA